jgi:hypothetical protein
MRVNSSPLLLKRRESDGWSVHSPLTERATQHAAGKQRGRSSRNKKIYENYVHIVTATQTE